MEDGDGDGGFLVCDVILGGGSCVIYAIINNNHYFVTHIELCDKIWRRGGASFLALKCVTPFMDVPWQDSSKTRAWIWMKCCVSTDVGTWTNWLTFEPDPNHSPDAGTESLSPISYKRCNAEFYYVGKITRIMYWPPVAAARRGFKMVLFTASRWNTFVGGTCALPSALLFS